MFFLLFKYSWLISNVVKQKCKFKAYKNMCFLNETKWKLGGEALC